MSAPGHELSAYVPRLVRRWLVEDASSLSTIEDGTLAFVDISGFTRLSERLARRGRVGAEELTDAIGGCFAALLALAYEQGATLLKFGGDALLLLYTGDDHARRACASAVGMRHELGHAGRLDTSVGRVRLRMSIGVDSGPVHLFLVGGSHRELLVGGPTATATVAAEAAAEAGEIVVGPATAAALPTELLGDARGPGFLLRRAPVARAAAVRPGTAWLDADVLACLPPPIRAHALASGTEPEHRRVTIAFVAFDGLDAQLAAAGSTPVALALDDLVRSVQVAADEHAVTFLGTDVAAGGGKVILTAGAPASAGDDEERMLLTLRRVTATPSPFPLAVGVHAGPVFAGDIGPPYRRAYTVMGDAVNLAARVMGRARPGEVLATPNVLAASRTRFVATPVEPFRVKGKRDPVDAALVGPVDGRRGPDSSARLPLVGRGTELRAVDAVVDEVLETHVGRALELSGDAGSGKSRLLEEIHARVADRAETHLLSCELHRTATPYATTRRLLRDLLDIDQGADPARAGTSLRALLETELPHLVPWAPLLAVALGGELADTPRTATLDDRYRRPRLHALVGELLAWRLQGPTVLLLDDVQWLDEPSADVLRALVRRIETQPWLVCTASRELPAPGTDPGPRAVRLPLGPLDAEASMALAAAATSASPLPAHRMEALVDRAGGNPLFLEELVAAATQEDFDDLPDSVESLVTARIDRLPPRERASLRHLSVLGRSFPRELGAEVLPDGVDLDRDVLDELGDLLVRDGEIVRFRQTLVRDVAYGGLRYGRRRDLHAAVGDLIAAAATGPQRPSALLSFHYLHAGRDAEAYRHALTAAEEAAAVYANADAVRFLERAVQAARRLEDLPDGALVGVHEKLGDHHDLLGSYRSAVTAYRTARRLLQQGRPADEARLVLKLARQHGRLDDTAHARRWILRARRLLRDEPDDAVRAQRAELAVWYAHFCAEEGRHQLALRWCDRAIADAELAGASGTLAHAYRVAGRSRGSLGDPAAAEDWTRALELYERIGDLDGQGAMTNNLGIGAYWEGRWGEAREHYRRSLEICRAIGDEDGLATAQKNLGLLLVEQGQLDQAQELIEAAMRIWRAAGHRPSVARARRELAWIAARSGRHDEAVAALSHAHADFQGIGAEVDDIDTLAVLAECHLLRGDPRAALPVLDEALDHDADLGGVSAQRPLLQRLRGYALLRTGRRVEARTALEDSLEAGRTREMAYEVAMTSRALVELAEGGGDGSQGLPVEELARDSARILEQLEVAWVPAIPAEGDAAAGPVATAAAVAPAGVTGRSPSSPRTP